MLKLLTPEQLYALEYRNEEEFRKFKPTKQNPKEIPFLKNNPRQSEVNGNSEP
jgi:hypothetical protein